MRISYLGAEERTGKAWDTTAYDADIIILCFNREQHTVAAVKSALSQKVVSTRITILDQGSSDATLDTLKNEIRPYPTVHLFIAAQNLGVGGGRNFLSSIGNGRIIVGLDNDAIFGDEYVVHKALKLFDEKPNLGAVGFNIRSRDGGHIDELCWGYPNGLKSRCDQRFLTTTFVGAGHAIRRATWSESGQYDSSLFFTWEEYDFCLRAIARNWDIMYDGSLCVHHDNCSEQRIRWSSGRQRLFVRNRLIIERKWGQGWLSLLPRIFGYIINGAINGQFRSTMLGIFDAIWRDKNSPKQKMTARMNNYLLRNEQQHRGSLYRRFRMEILKAFPDNS